jgi:hypothetical protein
VRKLSALLILAIVYFPLAFATLTLASIRPWVLDRGFYERIVNDERLYEAALTDDLSNRINNEAFTTVEQLPVSALSNALREVVGLTLVNASHPDQWLHMPIPNAKRSEWHGFLTDQKAGHLRLMDQIISLETRLNAIVYEAFDLTPEERQLIEDTTKYPYGEV